MDGRGRCKDNIWIERFWHTLKTEYVYPNPADTASELRHGISSFIAYYNHKRDHSQHDGATPWSVYSAA